MCDEWDSSDSDDDDVDEDEEDDSSDDDSDKKMQRMMIPIMLSSQCAIFQPMQMKQFVPKR